MKKIKEKIEYIPVEAQGSYECEHDCVTYINKKKESVGNPPPVVNGPAIYACTTIYCTSKKNKTPSYSGSNGSGKSTITKLLLRFYDVSEGEILINGVNIKEYNLESLRGEFAVYFQNELNFCSSIEDNISLFSDEIDSDSMNDVVDNFDLETIVKKGDEKLGFKQELYKRFEENGIEVSGGENQRIALARALYQNGSCIVLDEHTSAMDFIHMNKANKFIQNKYEDKIVIIITHKMDDFFENAKFLFVNNGVCKNISNKEIEQYMVEEVGL